MVDGTRKGFHDCKERDNITFNQAGLHNLIRDDPMVVRILGEVNISDQEANSQQ